MIKSGDMMAVSKQIQRMGKEIRQLIKGSFELSYFSRGAWSYHEVLLMSQAEREIASELINARLEIAGKQMFPVY